MDLRVEQVPISTLAAFMEAAAVHPSSDVQAIASFAGFSPRTAARALPSLETLGVIRRDGAGVYRVAVDGIGRGMDATAASTALRQALLSFRPFEMVCEGIAL